MGSGMSDQRPYYPGRTAARRGYDTQMDAGDIIRGQKQIAQRTQEGDQKAKLLAALQQQRAEAIAAGVMESALPVIHGQMSVRQLTEATQRINTLRGQGGASMTAGVAPANQPAPTGGRASAMIAGPLPGGATAAGQPVVANPPQAQAPQVVQPAFDPAQAAQQAAVGAAKFPMNPGAMAALDAWTPPAPVAIPGNQQPTNHALEQMVADGTLPRGADVTRTGAGYSTVVQSESGPRSVAFQPTMDQALAGDYGAKGQADYGKNWAQLSPEQKAATIRSRGINQEMAQGHKDLPEGAFKGFSNEYGSGFATVAKPQAPAPAVPAAPAPVEAPAAPAQKVNVPRN